MLLLPPLPAAAVAVVVLLQLVDLGCGYGGTAVYVAEQLKCKAVGVNISPFQVCVHVWVDMQGSSSPNPTMQCRQHLRKAAAAAAGTKTCNRCSACCLYWFCMPLPVFVLFCYGTC